MILRNSGEKLRLTIILLAKLHLAILGQLAPKSSILLSPAVQQHCTVDSTLLFSDLGLGGAASGLLAASEGGADEAGGKDGSSAA